MEPSQLVGPDTPDTSEREGELKDTRRPLPAVRRPDSPPPSPLYPVAPSPFDPQQQLVSSPVEGTAPQLPPAAAMQGYVAPPELTSSRGSYPPAGPSRSPLQNGITSRHSSAPLAFQAPALLAPTTANDIFSLNEPGPYPPLRARRTEMDSPPNNSLRAPLSRSQGKRAAVPSPTPMQASMIPPDVCVECMMRDRDMADVDVTTAGVWDRASDVDFYDALRAEETDSVQRRESTTSSRVNGAASGSDGDHGTGSRWSLGQPATGSSRESGSVDHSARYRTRRIGRGHDLTEASLKLWTSMKPAASSHRWRTLQLYLREQNRLIAIEKAEQHASEAERDRFEAALRDRASQDVTPSRMSFGGSRNRSSTMLPSGITIERVDIEKDEKALRKARARADSRGRRDSLTRTTSRPQSQVNYPYLNGHPRATRSSASLFAGRQDASPERRLSSPLQDTASRRSFPFFTQSATDLASPGGRPASLAPSDRLSGMFRGPRSASASVYSFAPSGSMIDMHVGLEQDRHVSMRSSDMDVIRQMSDDEVIQTSTKKKSKTLNKLLSKLNLRSSAPLTPPMIPPSPRGSTSLLAQSPVDEEPLEPPFPSYLAGDPAMHRRSPTVSTASSQPVTPELNAGLLGLSLPSQLPLRREKSLPALPMEEELELAMAARPSLAAYDRSASAPTARHPRAQTLDTSLTPSSDSTEHIGGGQKAKAARIHPRIFGFGGWKRRPVPADIFGSRDSLNEKPHFDLSPPGGAVEAVVRDVTFVATRYPSVA